MSKLHYCDNGQTVTDQVVVYQKSRLNDDYLPVQRYYDEYKEVWFKQLSDYMDKGTFNSEFDFKLVRAVESFDLEEAVRLAKKYKWAMLGMFNRWFYRILSNWKSNVKTSSFRVKKRPTITCPVCGREVGRIDAFHLQHYRTTKDLPKFFAYEGQIYSTHVKPLAQVTTYGKYSRKKLRELNEGKTKKYSDEKKKIEWPWETDGNPAVICPLTKKILVQISDEHIMSLPDRLSRYASPTSWEDFIETYPNCLIQSEIYSLDRPVDDDNLHLREQVSVDCRLSNDRVELDIEQIRDNKVTSKYESVFGTIDQHVDNTTDREILKLIAVGYSLEDIADSLEIEKSEIRKRVRGVRDVSEELENSLRGLV